MNGTKEVLTKQKTVMVPKNHKDRQSLQKQKKKLKPNKSKNYEGDLQNWGIPLTVITKEQFRQKK